MNIDEIKIEDLTFEDRDDFNRKPIAEKIIKILNADTNSFTPMVIDGDWGTGKTEFCFKLINLYKKKIKNTNEDKIKNTTIIYFDAFENDYLDNPLLSLLAKITKNLNNAEEIIIDKLKIISKNFPTFAIKTASKMILGEDVTKAGAELLQDKKSKNILNIFQEITDDMIQLKRNLKQLAENNPIIFFVDELDRCRPDYALKFLEIIKHTFDVPNIKFVFITKIELLNSSIEHSYGKKVQCDKYLDKFFKYRILLPLSSQDDTTDPVIYFLDLFRNFFDFSFFALGSSIIQINHFLYELSKKWLTDRTLRDVEIVIRYFKFYKIINISPIQMNSNGYIRMATIFLAALDRKTAKNIFYSDYTNIQNNMIFSDLLRLPKEIFEQRTDENIFSIIKDTLNQLNGLD